MMSLRAVKKIIQTKPTIEGAGVKLERAFGFGHTKDFDPFLLLDDFRNDNPEDYLAGFPWHPHRGIETITYVLAGSVEHGDSLGNRGTLGAGDVRAAGGVSANVAVGSLAEDLRTAREIAGRDPTGTNVPGAPGSNPEYAKGALVAHAPPSADVERGAGPA